MESNADHRSKGQQDYPKEGFALEWDEAGLLIRVTDYHPTNLRLPWADVLAMAAEGMGGRKVEESNR